MEHAEAYILDLFLRSWITGRYFYFREHNEASVDEGPRAGRHRRWQPPLLIRGQEQVDIVGGSPLVDEGPRAGRHLQLGGLQG